MRMTQTIYSTWLSQSSVVQEHTGNQGRAITWFKPEMIHPEIKKLWTGLLITEFPAPGKWMGPKRFLIEWERSHNLSCSYGLRTHSRACEHSLQVFWNHCCSTSPLLSPFSAPGVQCYWDVVPWGTQSVSHPTPPPPHPHPGAGDGLSWWPAVPVLSLLQDLHGVEALRFLDGADTALLLLQLQDRRRLPRGRLLHGGPGHSCGRGLGSGWGCGWGSATGCWCWQLLWGALATQQQVLPGACETRGTWQDRTEERTPADHAQLLQPSSTT